MKKLFLLSVLLCIFGTAQTITPKNIANIVDDIYNQDNNSFLEKNGFQYWTDTEKGSNWYNQKTKESVELTYDSDYYKEGGKHIVAIYNLENSLHQNFTKQLASAKFIYSKRNKNYVRRFNTYTYEIIKIEPIGKNANITYINHQGKENGSPSLNFPKPPKQDTIITKEKNGNDTIVRKYIGTRQIEKSRFSKGKLVAQKNFLTRDFKRFDTDSKIIYHSYPQKNDKEFILQEWDSEGKEKYKSVYSDITKDILVYQYGVLFQKKKILKTEKLLVTEYDKQGNVVSESEDYMVASPQDYDESEY